MAINIRYINTNNRKKIQKQKYKIVTDRECVRVTLVIKN